MSYLITWSLCIHFPSKTVMLYTMSLSIHMHGECEGRKQSHIGIIIRLI